MKPKDGNTQSSSPGTWLVVAGLVLLALLVWFGMSAQRGKHLSRGDSPPLQGSDDSTTRTESRDGASGDAPQHTHSRKRPPAPGVLEDDALGSKFPLLEQILADDKLSTQETAKQLLQIASRSDLSLLEREEALAHGLNLDFPQFIGLVADPKLPQPLAQRFFEEMLNQNSRRELQVRACIALVDHEDSAMREEAADQLAFYIGLEEWSGEPEVLKQEGHAFLEDWAKRPVPEPIPVDPDAGIPETAPIDPRENEEEDSSNDQ